MCHFRFDPEPWQRRAAIHAARQPVSPAILPFSLSASHLSSDAAAAADAAFEGQCGAHLGKISNWSRVPIALIPKIFKYFIKGSNEFGGD